MITFNAITEDDRVLTVEAEDIDSAKEFLITEGYKIVKIFPLLIKI